MFVCFDHLLFDMNWNKVIGGPCNILFALENLNVRNLTLLIIASILFK